MRLSSCGLVKCLNLIFMREILAEGVGHPASDGVSTDEEVIHSLFAGYSQAGHSQGRLFTGRETTPPAPLDSARNRPKFHCSTGVRRKSGRFDSKQGSLIAGAMRTNLFRTFPSRC